MENTLNNQLILRIALFSLVVLFLLASALSFKNTVAAKQDEQSETNIEVAKTTSYVMPNFLPITQIGY